MNRIRFTEKDKQNPSPISEDAGHEIRVMLHLRNPGHVNILHCYEVVEDDGDFFHSFFLFI